MKELTLMEILTYIWTNPRSLTTISKTKPNIICRNHTYSFRTMMMMDGVLTLFEGADPDGNFTTHFTWGLHH
jgi:hypothetical protein